eukprot:352884-Chlamydomonas_euryale.AAC.5
MPVAWFVSAMPAPDLSPEARPWRVSARLDDNAFVEECRAWGINEVVFQKDLWTMYKPLLRADFKVWRMLACCLNI